MTHARRWFGPHDPVSIGDMRQAGVQGIARRQNQRAAMRDGAPSGLSREVAEPRGVGLALSPGHRVS